MANSATGYQSLNLQHIAEVVPGMVAVYDIQTGQYLYVNKAVRKILGYTAKDLIKGGIEFATSLVHPDDIERVLLENQAALREANKSGKTERNRDAIVSFEYRMRHKSGKWVWLHTDGGVYKRDENGRVQQVINISIDITPNKAAEVKLRKLSNELEVKVKERTERLEMALDSSQMGMWEWDIKANRLNWSDKLKTLYGLDKNEEITFAKYLRLIHPDDRARVRETIQAAMKDGKSYRMEHRIVWPDKTEHWVQGQGKAFIENGKAVRMMGTSMNIDDRKAGEKVLLESEHHFRTMANHVPMIIWTSRADGYCDYLNQQWQEFTGQPVQEGLGFGWMAVTHKDDVERVYQFYTTQTKRRGVASITYRLKRKDGSYHWIMDKSLPRLNKRGGIIGYIGAIVDIHEQKMAEESLKENQAKYQTLFDSNIMGVVIPDIKGKIHDANKTFLKMLGYTRRQLLSGKISLPDLTPTEYRQMDKQKVKELLKTGEATPWEKEYIRRDGTRVPVLTGVVVMPTSPELCLTFVFDITERKQLAELNQAKDEFISLASHQLRTPASGVKMYTGMLLEGYAGPLNKQQREMLEIAYASNERQLKIIDDLLLVAQVDAGKVRFRRRQQEVSKILEEVIKEQTPTLQARHQQVVIEDMPKNTAANVDGKYLRMVFENIISNASKYSHHNTTIRIRAKRQNGCIVITVQDQGVGIREKDKAKLFQKFSRIENPLTGQVEGTGLGLYWSKKIIDLHKGSLELTSKWNHGSAFTVKLPIQ